MTRRPLASIQPTIRVSAVYSSMGASSGMYATAAAAPLLATPALVPRRQFQKVKGASYTANREAARGLWAERYRPLTPASTGRQYY